MNLIEKQHCYLIEDFFPQGVIAGFTKPTLQGILPHDIYTALSFLKLEFGVSYMRQLHSAIVHCIDTPKEYEGDALFTNKNRCALVVKTADCLPLFFFSNELEIAGIVHMGWRCANAGILDNIPYEADFFKVLAGVGLRYCCYEAGKEFLDYSGVAKYVRQSRGKLYFEPVSFAKDKLEIKGLRKENFYDLGICSFCSPKDFFSYRKTKTTSRTLSFIMKI